jgi:hypothetical protein
MAAATGMSVLSWKVLQAITMMTSFAISTLLGIKLKEAAKMQQDV